MLSAASISYRVGQKRILHDITADFLPGEFNMILGPNGSGKSSFLRIFSGEIQDYKGTVRYEEQELVHIRKQQLAKARAVMSQQPELGFPLAVEEVVMMGRYPHFNLNPGKKDEQICEEVIRRMNLAALKERNYLTLSGGEKQRVHFARLLAQVWEKPVKGLRYLLLDEPLTSLDISYQHEFLEIAREFLDSDTVLVAILHDINLAIQYADKLFFLKEGELVARGKPVSVLTETLIERVFGVKTTIIENPITGSPLVIYSR